jgi:hypothetical protein
MAPLVLTMGEPAGIGGEISLKAWLARLDGVPPFYLIDDPDRLAGLARQLGWPVPIHPIGDPAEAPDVFDRALPILPVGIQLRGLPARPDPGDAPAILGAIEAAVRDVQAGRAAAHHDERTRRLGEHGHGEGWSNANGAKSRDGVSRTLAVRTQTAWFSAGNPACRVINPMFNRPC